MVHIHALPRSAERNSSPAEEQTTKMKYRHENTRRDKTVDTLQTPSINKTPRELVRNGTCHAKWHCSAHSRSLLTSVFRSRPRANSGGITNVERCISSVTLLLVYVHYCILLHFYSSVVKARLTTLDHTIPRGCSHRASVCLSVCPTVTLMHHI